MSFANWPGLSTIAWVEVERVGVAGTWLGVCPHGLVHG